ncbi:putative aminoacrylate hydrolase RutD [Methanocorpusculaceae archaeon Sp1]|nr:putative aminoacrylate hydrolase RutD [Methanocorpusculaceae archaeon Sp1]
MRKILSVVFLLSFLVLSVFAAGCIVSQTITETEVSTVNLTEWYLSTPVQYVEVNNVTIAYREFGTSNADPLLMIVGYRMTMDGWDPTFISSLADDYHVYVYDHRAMGYSSNDPSTPYTMNQLTNDAAALVKAFGYERMYVFGHSMGSTIGLEFAVMHPDAIIRLVLASVTPSPHEPYCRSLMNVVESAIADPATEQGIYYESVAIKESVPVTDQLGNVTLDVLVIVGTEDDVTPVEGCFVVAEKIPGASLVQFKGCTHEIFVEKPYEVADVMTGFYQNTVTAVPAS